MRDTLKELDEETSAISTKLDNAANQIKTSMTSDEVAEVQGSLTGISSRLKVLASNPENPVPEPPTEPEPSVSRSRNEVEALVGNPANLYQPFLGALPRFEFPQPQPTGLQAFGGLLIDESRRRVGFASPRQPVLRSRMSCRCWHRWVNQMSQGMAGQTGQPTMSAQQETAPAKKSTPNASATGAGFRAKPISAEAEPAQPAEQPANAPGWSGLEALKSVLAGELPEQKKTEDNPGGKMKGLEMLKAIVAFLG
jgi:hypothetical protein